MVAFAIGIEHALDVPVQRSHYSDTLHRDGSRPRSSSIAACHYAVVLGAGRQALLKRIDLFVDLTKFVERFLEEHLFGNGFAILRILKSF
jgi:hypothetical protein